MDGTYTRPLLACAMANAWPRVVVVALKARLELPSVQISQIFKLKWGRVPLEYTGLCLVSSRGRSFFSLGYRKGIEHRDCGSLSCLRGNAFELGN
uniref:Secreted protein n=1 Tax=Heterorhabditis bacteriophora TaxID=37862 RepID=A0A1I7WDM1_HETBA